MDLFIIFRYYRHFLDFNSITPNAILLVTTSDDYNRINDYYFHNDPFSNEAV